MKNILVITASLRHNSNSDTLANSFIEGARAAGNNITLVSLKEKKMAFCTGCMACQKNHECVIKDDAPAITREILNADAVAFSSPVYYYSIPGQLKTLFDRSNSLYTSPYKFREVYFLSTATEDFSHTPLGALEAVRGWVDCFPNALLAGSVFCGGVSNEGDILLDIGKTALKKAYEMGFSIK